VHLTKVEGLLLLIFVYILFIIGWHGRFIVRPESFGLLGVVLLFCYLPSIFKNKLPSEWLKSKKYYALVIGIILWSNLHFSFSLGLFIIAIYLFTIALEKKELFKDYKFWITGLILPISIIINPNGFNHYVLLFDLYFSNDTSNYIVEMRPLYKDIPFFSYQSIIVILSIIIIIYNVYKKIFFNAIILLVILIITLDNNRFFAFLVTALILIGVSSFLDLNKYLQKQKKEFSTIFFILIATIIFGGGQILHKQTLWNKIGFGFNYNKFTNGISDFIIDNKLEGKMFNSFFWGSYLLWKLYPDHQVFIDTRAHTYGGELLTNYYFLLEEPYRWKALEEKYNFQFAVLRYPEIIPSGQEANNYMKLFPKNKWGLAYFDQSGFILVNRNGPNKRLADNYEYINPFAKNNISYLNYYIQEGKAKEVMAELSKAINLNPKNSYAHFQMAYIYAQIQPIKTDSIIYHLKKTNEVEPIGKKLLEMYLNNK